MKNLSLKFKHFNISQLIKRQIKQFEVDESITFKKVHFPGDKESRV